MFHAARILNAVVRSGSPCQTQARGKRFSERKAAGRLPTNCACRLPMEAEWEYACRAGTSTRFSYGDDPGYTNLTNYAWYWENSGGTTHPVGQKLPNPWGLYDMHGNVREWCQDWWADNLPGGLVLDPPGASWDSLLVVVRGGGWGLGFDCDNARYCRSAHRIGDYPYDRWFYDQGFRVVLAPGQP